MSPAPGMIFKDPTGRYAFYARSEEREHVGGKRLEHLFILIRDGVVFQRWTDTLPDEYELVNDTAGRAEASLAWAEVQALQLERDALSKCLKAAVAMLDDRAAEELRGIYRGAMEKAELISA